MKLKNFKQFNDDLNSVKVKNLIGTVSNDKKCTPCKSWINHWEKLAKKSHDGCGVKGCTAITNIEGGHVIKSGSDDDKHYIVPLCDKHNGGPDGEEFIVKLDDLMSAIECKA